MDAFPTRPEMVLDLASVAAAGVVILNNTGRG